MTLWFAATEASRLVKTGVNRTSRVRDKAFSSLFQSEIGWPPWTYVVRRRMEIATRLLRDTNLEIGLIGRMVGYRDGSPYSTSFWTALEDAYARLLLPSVATEVMGDLKGEADRAAVEVFAETLGNISSLRLWEGGRSSVSIPAFAPGASA